VGLAERQDDKSDAGGSGVVTVRLDHDHLT
jgi:hypothetical protein